MKQHEPARPIMGVAAITERALGEANPVAIRKVRRLIRDHGFPVHQRGRIIWAFPDEIDAYLRGNGSQT